MGKICPNPLRSEVPLTSQRPKLVWIAKSCVLILVRPPTLRDKFGKNRPKPPQTRGAFDLPAPKPSHGAPGFGLAQPQTHVQGGGRVGVKTGSPAGWQGRWMVVADSYLDCGLPECRLPERRLPECRLPVRSVVNAYNKK